MHYHWENYHELYREIVEAWFDREAVEYTGCDEGWDAFFTYWINEPGTVLDENFFVKVIMEAEKAIGVMAVFREEDRYYIQEFVISPDRRGMGIGSSILKELIKNGETIIGKTIKSAEACIFPSNVASIKAFEKAGFQYSHAHPDGDAWYYVYQQKGLSGQNTRPLA